jgi:hypothetical protein
MDIARQSPRAAVAHQRFLFDGETICRTCAASPAGNNPLAGQSMR